MSGQRNGVVTICRAVPLFSCQNDQDGPDLAGRRPKDRNIEMLARYDGILKASAFRQCPGCGRSCHDSKNDRAKAGRGF
ncbi:hypothetical protein AA3250_1706 [Gluconobacter albidus NBRC 3250]|nr:hypothetical protein AA3250_1706 [Gluconobacter albidus NBRC 3250]